MSRWTKRNNERTATIVAPNPARCTRRGATRNDVRAAAVKASRASATVTRIRDGSTRRRDGSRPTRSAFPGRASCMRRRPRSRFETEGTYGGGPRGSHARARRPGQNPTSTTVGRAPFGSVRTAPDPNGRPRHGLRTVTFLQPSPQKERPGGAHTFPDPLPL